MKSHSDLPLLPPTSRPVAMRAPPSWLVLSPGARERINMRVHGLTPKGPSIIFRLEDLRLSEGSESSRKPHVFKRKGLEKTPILRRAGESLSGLKPLGRQPSSKALSGHTTEAHSPASSLQHRDRKRELVRTLRKVKGEAPLTPTAWTPDISDSNN